MTIYSQTNPLDHKVFLSDHLPNENFIPLPRYNSFAIVCTETPTCKIFREQRKVIIVSVQRIILTKTTQKGLAIPIRVFSDHLSVLQKTLSSLSHLVKEWTSECKQSIALLCVVILPKPILLLSDFEIVLLTVKIWTFLTWKSLKKESSL